MSVSPENWSPVSASRENCVVLPWRCRLLLLLQTVADRDDRGQEFRGVAMNLDILCML